MKKSLLQTLGIADDGLFRRFSDPFQQPSGSRGPSNPSGGLGGFGHPFHVPPEGPSLPPYKAKILALLLTELGIAGLLGYAFGKQKSPISDGESPPELPERPELSGTPYQPIPEWIPNPKARNPQGWLQTPRHWLDDVPMTEDEIYFDENIRPRLGYPPEYYQRLGLPVPRPKQEQPPMHIPGGRR